MAPTMPFLDINAYASAGQYTFSSPSAPDAPALVVDRPTGDVRLQDARATVGHRLSSIYGILGIVGLRLDKYIIVVKSAKSVGTINGHTVFNIVSTDLLPLRERSVRDPDEDAYIALVRHFLKAGPMYFSYSLDLTNSFQRQAQSDHSLSLWQRADDRFFWNRFIQSSFIDFRHGHLPSRQSRGPQPHLDPYILPVISGMLRITNTSVFGNPLNFVLITRKSRHRAGTRYFSRGIDDRGRVSNYNETEQTILLGDPVSSHGARNYSSAAPTLKASRVNETQILSYVQTRGSVPLYWHEVNEIKYKPRLQVMPIDSAVRPARLHFDEQIKLYGDNYLVNLVNADGREKHVKDAYEDVIKRVVSAPAEHSEADSKTNEAFHVIEPHTPGQRFDRLHYIYFDFHTETKGLKFTRTKLLLDQLESGLQAGAYYRGVDTPNTAVSVQSTQSAVVRTNCMDCLDRTNVVQSMLGRYMLTRMLSDLELLRPGQNIQDDQAFEHVFRNVWADNADVVSKAYSGTGALKTDFTRTGKRSTAGAWQDFVNSCTRYVLNNFVDGSRQDAFDLFLGAYKPDPAGFGSARHFIDARPVLVQAVPYAMAACFFFLLVALLTTRAHDAAVWPLRLFTFVCLALGLWSVRFIVQYGPLYVNWPKLNPPQWASEVFHDTIEKAARDPIIGPFIAMPGRKGFESRLNHLEEGKKRIE